MHVDMNPISRLKLGVALQANVGGGSVDRVRSDALPLTMHASKLTVPETVTVPGAEDHQSDLSDLNSMAVEVGSSLDSLSSSKLSIAHSHRSVSSSALGSRELHAQFHRDSSESHQKQKSDDSFITSVLAASHGRGERESGITGTRGARPGSAPTRATSDSLIPLPPSSTPSSSSSSSTEVPKLHRLRDRKISVEDERQKRLANIAESTRAALTFSAMHKSKKSESLPRDQRFGSKSVGSEEELLGISLQSKPPSSPAATMSSPSSPFNLRNMSIDETRKASMNEMEEIWKLVENESGGSSTSLNISATGGGEGGAGMGGRRPPSIALESHFSPRHVFSGATDSGKQGEEEVEEKGAERKSRKERVGVVSPVRRAGRGEAKGGEGREERKVGAQQRSSALDTSEVEVERRELEEPLLQSTPKGSGGAQQPRAPDVSMIARGQRSASVTSKGEGEKKRGRGREGGEDGVRSGGNEEVDIAYLLTPSAHFNTSRSEL